MAHPFLRASTSPSLRKIQKLRPARQYDTYIPDPSDSPLPPLLDTKTIIRTKSQHNLAMEVVCLLMERKNYTLKEVWNPDNLHRQELGDICGMGF